MTDEIKKREFKFSEQEAYSPGEVQNILNQHSEFISGATKKELEALKAQNSTLATSVSEFKSAERNRLVKKLAKSISEDKYEKLVKYTSIPEEADEATIKNLLMETSKDFIAVNTAEPKVEIKGTPPRPAKAKEKKIYRFVK